MNFVAPNSSSVPFPALKHLTMTFAVNVASFVGEHSCRFLPKPLMTVAWNQTARYLHLRCTDAATGGGNIAWGEEKPTAELRQQQKQEQQKPLPTPSPSPPPPPPPPPQQRSRRRSSLNSVKNISELATSAEGRTADEVSRNEDSTEGVRRRYEAARERRTSRRRGSSLRINVRSIATRVLKFSSDHSFSQRACSGFRRKSFQRKWKATAPHAHDGQMELCAATDASVL